MPTAEVNGTSLHYEAVGEGPTCLVLHGWPGTDHSYLRPGLDPLADRLRLVYYDHRGHGRSGRPPVGTLTLEQLADDAEALAAHLGAGEVFVLGHFHGASVAQELALRHPARVAGLILLAATPGQLGVRESLADFLDAPPTPPEVEVLQRVPPGTDEELAATVRALTPFFSSDPEVARRAAPFAGAIFNAPAAAAWMQRSGWWSAVDRLTGLSRPTLLLVGRHDVFAGPVESRRIGHAVPGAQTAVLEHSGHLPWLEEPDALASAVRTWLAEI